MGRKTPKLLLPLGIITLPEEDRTTAIGNIRREIGTDRACGSGDMLADRQTDRQTDVLITVLRHRSCRRINIPSRHEVCGYDAVISRI